MVFDNILTVLMIIHICFAMLVELPQVKQKRLLFG